MYKNESKIWNVFICDNEPEEWKISNIKYTAYSLSKLQKAVTNDELSEIEVITGLIKAYEKSLDENWYTQADDEATRQELRTMYIETLVALYCTNKYKGCNLEFVSQLQGDVGERLRELEKSEDMLGVQRVNLLEIEETVKKGKCDFEGLSSKMFAKLDTKSKIVESMPEDWTALVMYIEQGGDVSENIFYLNNINSWVDQYFNEKISMFKKK